MLKGWETGSEYLYDYSGLLVTGIEDAHHQSAAVQIIAKLTVQSVDDETLMLKVPSLLLCRWKSCPLMCNSKLTSELTKRIVMPAISYDLRLMADVRDTGHARWQLQQQQWQGS
jgi:hypothetical protein